MLYFGTFLEGRVIDGWDIVFRYIPLRNRYLSRRRKCSRNCIIKLWYASSRAIQPRRISHIISVKKLKVPVTIHHIPIMYKSPIEMPIPSVPKRHVHNSHLNTIPIISCRERQRRVSYHVIQTAQRPNKVSILPSKSLRPLKYGP